MCTHFNNRFVLLHASDVPDPPIDVELTHCGDRIAQLQWKLISENYSPVIQFMIEYNTSFSPGTWKIAKTQLPRDRYGYCTKANAKCCIQTDRILFNLQMSPF